MTDYRRTLEDHLASLFLLNEGLQNAEALMIFLMAFGSTLRALDDGVGYTPRRDRFLTEFDNCIEQVLSGLGSDSEVVQAVRNFRQKFDQLIAEMDMYERPPQ